MALVFECEYDVHTVVMENITKPASDAGGEMTQ